MNKSSEKDLKNVFLLVFIIMPNAKYIAGFTKSNVVVTITKEAGRLI